MTASLANAQGYPVTAATPAIVERLDGVVDAYLGARATTRERLEGVLRDDPDCVMAQYIDGYLAMLSSRSEGIERARKIVVDAGVASARRRVTQREGLHLAALGAWAAGDMRDAVRRWDALLAEFPRDILALKVSQFVLSYLGESQRMRDTVERVLPAWDAAVPGFGYVLGCHAYGLEESGDLAQAEAVGLRAVEINPADIWAAHAVAHVREMQGRLREGIAWISALSGQWAECSYFARHLRWHEGLYHLDLDEHERVIELYDREVRAQSTDEYLDVANAVSLLWRLEQADVDVGSRWSELAERARAHVDDHALVFVDLHYLMALAAARDDDGVEAFLESCERFAMSGSGTEAAVMAEVGLPLACAVLAHRRGAYGDVVDLLIPIRHRVRTIGASHAQRDLFEQLLIDAARRSSRLDVAALLLAERTEKRPGNRWARKHQAAVLEALGAPGASDARHALDRLDVP